MRSDNIRRHDSAVGTAPIGFDPKFPILLLKAELPARADGHGDRAGGQCHTTSSIADKEIAVISSPAGPYSSAAARARGAEKTTTSS